MRGADLSTSSASPPETPRPGAARASRISEIATSVVVLANAGLGMIAQIVLASRFGASRTLDGFFAASAAPFGIIGLAVTAFGAVMIPALGDARGDEDWYRRASELVSAAIVIACAVAFAGLLSAGAASWARADDSHLRMAALEAAPALWIACGFGIVSQAAIAIHHWRGRFVTPSLASALYPTSLIVTALALGDRFGSKPLAIGYAIAGLAQCIILALMEPRFPRVFVWPTADSVRIMRGSLMVCLAVLPTVFFPISDAFWMSTLDRPGLTYLNFASRLTVSLAGIITTGTAVVSFPRFVALASERRYRELEADLLSSLKRCVGILGLVSVALFLVRDPLLTVLFEHGRFTAGDRAALAGLLPFYLIGMILMGCSNLVVRGYYAVGARSALASLGLLAVTFYALTSGLLASRLGYIGIGAAHVGTWLLFVLSQLVFLHRRLRGLSLTGQ